MKLNQIITSLLETDMYKFSMGQTIFHQFTDYKTTWTFKCRNTDVHFTPEMVQEITEQIEAFCKLRFTEDELAYLDNIKWIKGSYVDFLRLWQPRFEDFEIGTDAPCGLSIEAKGTWLNTSMYEIPTLAIVNEVYFRMAYDYDKLLDSFKKRLDAKYENLKNGHWYAGTFSEFGLRRRLSAEAQELAVQKFAHLNDTLHSSSKFVGTSNVYLAKKYGLTPVGTMAHEWIMCTGQGNHKHNPAYSNWYALDAWVKEYGVLNGIALTDTITTDCFLRDPSKYVDKTPSDGLCGKTDEDNFGFTYEQLDTFIRNETCGNKEIDEAIRRKHLANEFKLNPVTKYEPGIYTCIPKPMGILIWCTITG